LFFVFLFFVFFFLFFFWCFLAHKELRFPHCAHHLQLDTGKPLGGAPNPVFASAQWEFANGGVLEVLASGLLFVSVHVADGKFLFMCQALDPPPFLDEASLNKNFMYQFLTSGGPRVHHVTFKVC
jgi:hypothetical protein